MTAFGAGAGDRGGGENVDHRALADIIASEHDKVT